MPAEDSLYLFQASCFYGFTNNRLQAFCKHNLENNITHENVLQILEAADNMNVPDIKSYALRMIAHDFQRVKDQPKLVSLSKPLVHDVLLAMGELNHQLQIQLKLDITSRYLNSDI